MNTSSLLMSMLLGLTATPAFSIVENSGDSATNWEKKRQIIVENFSPPKFGGYFVGKYDWNDREGQSTNGGFDLRYFRLYLDGKCLKEFSYRFQGELSSAPGTDKGPRILDAFVEWQKYDEFRIKLGQFKRPFTFENPMNPWNVGFGAYSQAISKLAGMSDRVGEHASSGRDVGIQAQGDFIKIGQDQHPFVHYQVGLFNGQGINHSDKNKFKDIIGTIWLSPIRELQIGCFGWSGLYTNENYTHQAGTLREVDRNRWGVGVNYESKITVRAEYVASEGGVVNNSSKANKADGWYAAIGTPVTRRVKVFGRWDCYRDNKEWNSLKTIWEATANYSFTKNLMFQANYSFTNDHSTKIGSHYNTIDLQLYARF